jgi:hypothetical protein
MLVVSSRKDVRENVRNVAVALSQEVVRTLTKTTGISKSGAYSAPTALRGVEAAGGFRDPCLHGSDAPDGQECCDRPEI